MLFQNDFDKLCNWKKHNLMDFNSKKCKIMRITEKQLPFTNRVHLSDTVLEGFKQFKDYPLTNRARGPYWGILARGRDSTDRASRGP